jgi:glucose/mannose transport system substrate-binding protein
MGPVIWLALMGLTPGKQIGCQLAPGNADTYLLVIDAFAFPLLDGPDKKKWQNKLAETMVDPAVQVRFSQLKGSIPVRSDADVSKLDTCAQLGMRMVARTENQVLPPSMRLQFNVRAGLTGLIGKFFHEGHLTPEKAAESLALIFEKRGPATVAVR